MKKITNYVFPAIACVLLIAFIILQNSIKKPISHTISFNSNGGSEVSSLQNIPHNTIAKAPKSPVKEGYNFLGWFEEEKNGLFLGEFKFYNEKVIKNLVLIAKWEEAKFIVRFVGMNDEKLSESIVKYNENAIAPIPPIIENYKFSKWDRDFLNVKYNMTVKAIYILVE